MSSRAQKSGRLRSDEVFKICLLICAVRQIWNCAKVFAYVTTNRKSVVRMEVIPHVTKIILCYAIYFSGKNGQRSSPCRWLYNLKYSTIRALILRAITICYALISFPIINRYIKLSSQTLPTLGDKKLPFLFQ